MRLKFYYFITIIAILFASCENDSTSDLSDNTPIEVVSYSTDVRPIITNSCLSCHSAPPVNGAPISLVTYDQVRNAMEEHGLMERISRDPSDSGMMPFGGPRLPQHIIDIIAQWKSDGFQP